MDAYFTENKIEKATVDVLEIGDVSFHTGIIFACDPFTFTLPGMAFARDGSGGEYHLLVDGSIGYYSSEGEAGRLAENMDDLFSLLVSCICWKDYCDANQYVDSKTLEEYGQKQRSVNLEDIDVDSLRQISDAFGIATDKELVPILERFRKATQRQPLYQCVFHEDDGSLTESYGLMFE